MYEDYLEEFVFKTAKLIASKLFGRPSDSKEEENEELKPLLPSSTADEIVEDNKKETHATETITETKGEIVKELNKSRLDDAIPTDSKAEDPSDQENNAILDAKSDTGNENNTVARCNTYDLLCSQMSEEIAAAEEIQEREANHVVTKEGKKTISSRNVPLWNYFSQKFANKKNYFFLRVCGQNKCLRSPNRYKTVALSIVFFRLAPQFNRKLCFIRFHLWTLTYNIIFGRVNNTMWSH